MTGVSLRVCLECLFVALRECNVNEVSHVEQFHMLNRNCRSVEQMSTLYEISHNLSAGRHNLICSEIYPTLEVSSARYHGSCENHRTRLLELKAVVRKLTWIML